MLPSSNSTATLKIVYLATLPALLGDFMITTLFILFGGRKRFTDFFFSVQLIFKLVRFLFKLISLIVNPTLFDNCMLSNNITAIALFNNPSLFNNGMLSNNVVVCFVMLCIPFSIRTYFNYYSISTNKIVNSSIWQT